jgi:signal transduction histidine kinase
LQAVIQRTQFTTGEGAVAFVDGQLWWTAPTSVTLRPEDDEDFLEAMAPLTTLDTTSSGAFANRGYDLRFIVVPVHYDDGEVGALVKVHDMRVELAPFRALMLSYILTGVGVLMLIGLIIWSLVGRLLAPVAALRKTAASISEADLTQRVPIRGHDELAQLSITVNDMLDRVESAVSSQQELLDDVGHELRTPLTIMRGNLEVMDIHDTEDIVSTKKLVIEEIDRMHRMVEDILTIANTNQVDFIQNEPVDILVLTDATFQKASALGDRHWKLDEMADGEVTLDPQRTTQAWLQLVTNAVQYSAVGSEIGIGSRISDGQLHLWVRDQGVGIAPNEINDIMQRHTRGTSGLRFHVGNDSHPGGAGLGLDIVNSIARAQGGSVEVVSQLRVGSTFTIVLPINHLSTVKVT